NPVQQSWFAQAERHAFMMSEDNGKEGALCSLVRSGFAKPKQMSAPLSFSKPAPALVCLSF
ncbi:hypothetical protein RM533_12605, partial [Croceicoccus sp. F390]